MPSALRKDGQRHPLTLADIYLLDDVLQLCSVGAACSDSHSLYRGGRGRLFAETL
jgi:hypothetical protein